MTEEVRWFMIASTIYLGWVGLLLFLSIVFKRLKPRGR